MLKTSFRIPEDTSEKLAQIADKVHNGNRTAALAAAVEHYYASLFSEPAAPVGWLSVRVSGKPRCVGCKNPIDGQGYVRLFSDGSVTAGLHCSKCAK